MLSEQFITIESFFLYHSLTAFNEILNFESSFEKNVYLVVGEKKVTDALKIVKKIPFLSNLYTGCPQKKYTQALWVAFKNSMM